MAGNRQRALVPLRTHTDPVLRLFLFPYAGGSARAFPGWSERLPIGVACYAIQLPGRGERLKERPFTNLTAVVDCLLVEMLSSLPAPFAFFGHSMGALVAFELTRRLQMTSGLTPAHLFVSGHGAPHLCSMGRRLYDLPDDELIEEVGRLGGVPEAVRTDAELMRLIIPTLRADFSVTQTYVFAGGPRLECPITALGGTRDVDVIEEHIVAWREHTTRAFTMHMIEGDHFFINTATTRVCSILARTLSPILHTMV